MIVYSWFTYDTLWFFIAMLVYLMNKMKFNTWGWCVRLWKFLTCGRISSMFWLGWSGAQILPFGDGSKPYGFKCLRSWYIVPPTTQITSSEGTFPELDDGIICSEPRCLMVKLWFPGGFPLIKPLHAWIILDPWGLFYDIWERWALSGCRYFDVKKGYSSGSLNHNHVGHSK